VQPAEPFEVFGVRLLGISVESGLKLLLSIALIAIVLVVRRLVLRLIRALPSDERAPRVRFWGRQAVSLGSTAVIVFGLVSLWFDDPGRAGTALGLFSAGLAFALQKVVTAIAGYVVIMRGKVFRVGDRIVMGGVRGDVIDVAFTQTTVMEMGHPPTTMPAAANGLPEQALWVQSRQYTGRMVNVSNARIFDEPIYNYTREFPYIWEELTIPIRYDADRARVEQLLLDVAGERTRDIQAMSDDARAELTRRYHLRSTETAPRVYMRITDNWLELTVRFLARDHDIRDLMDAMCRDILQGLEEADIEVASATYRIVGLPRIEVALDHDEQARGRNSTRSHPRRRSS
jgi:small-conductance mechanosensitive channel